MPAVDECIASKNNTKTVPVEQAVGMVLPHDITEIVKDVRKGRAFKKGHIIRPEDVETLRRLGKEHIYVLNLGPQGTYIEMGSPYWDWRDSSSMSQRERSIHPSNESPTSPAQWS